MDRINTPILFLIFNRPDTTSEVFKEIRKATPKKLFIAADGSRPNIPGEKEKCDEVRKIIEHIDWDCEIKTLFRNENIGCKSAVSGAISWFFNHVEEGIILEDDCKPNESFFSFCQIMLDRYRDDNRVMMISGTNYLFNTEKDYKIDYFFSRYYAIWGWATWKRAWKMYNIEMKKWPYYRKKNYLWNIYRNWKIEFFFRNMFDLAYTNKVNTWDIQWVYTCIFQNTLAIVPIYNLISNIGEDGTHTGNRKSRSIRMPTRMIENNFLEDQIDVVCNYELDEITMRNILGNRNIIDNIKNILKYYLKR